MKIEGKDQEVEIAEARTKQETEKGLEVEVEAEIEIAAGTEADDPKTIGVAVVTDRIKIEAKINTESEIDTEKGHYKLISYNFFQYILNFITEFTMLSI